ncbi:alpha/beta hydrolase [Rhizobium sp. Leaf262]|uniref:alpha/beta fold hydrolase n=1 Tax=Rhizobium sp. Leaf262 TaxID=1736312 RepID=UPI0007132D48|nr:alpha/beta hydrolase [Rhizobium sp. Leaf262]KQO75085.1 hydrolase [Rhizobium sp. Leaf262]
MSTFSTLFASGAIALGFAATISAARAEPIRNIVLVHGAFADGSGWQPVYERLVRKGYKVAIVQEPETTLEEDVAATLRVIDQQDGAVVLVGHSWGGQVITDAGADPKVKALVYLAGLMPDVGESTETLETMPQFPAPNNDVKRTDDGFFYMDPAKYHENFAADSPKALADFMAASQVLLSEKAFKTPAKAAPWKTKPTYAVVPGADKTINVDLQRWMYKRAKAEVTEVPGSSHTVFLSHPDIVVSVIEKAASK